MSYVDGWAALNLQMPDRIPRTEASVDYPVQSAVSGIKITPESPGEDYLECTKRFVRQWDYGMLFGCAIGYNVLEKKHSSMGHAVYVEGGRDFDANIYEAFTDVDEALAFDPWETYGPADHAATVKLFDDQYANNCAAFPDTVNMTGVYTTQMSGMIAIFGWDMLLTMAGVNPKGFGDLVNRYASWMQQYYNALAESKTQVVYSHDDLVWTAGPFIHPDWYRAYIFPNLKKLWAPLVEAGKKVIFFCDGNYTPFIEDVAACGNAAFWFECFTDLAAVVERFGRTHAIIGNVDTRVLTFGTRKAIRSEVERCVALGRDCPGYFMCCSGHIPANVPIDNALYYNEVFEELRRR
ncbi:MAG: uroporphyrinogen decarboxylase family protein [Planctomycetaceae bacterium]|nr:uroporphyrinogen decarboxylase family protein [Planctomycetaceae bacterium]